MTFGKEDNGKKAMDDIIIYMARNVSVKGNISFEGTGRIDGKVEGTIRVQGNLILGEGAVVSSEIEGDTVVIGGEVHGKIVGRQKVQLLKTSMVHGDIITPCLLVEEGSQFNGNCKMGSGAAESPSNNHFEKENKKPSMVAVK